MTPQTIIAHGHCARVIDTPSQGISYLRIELPVEMHAQLTQRFYGKPVLVMLAGTEFAGQPFGLTLSDLPEGEAAPAPPAPSPAPPKPERKLTGPLCMSAVKLGTEPAFLRYVASETSDRDQATADEAAEYIKLWCEIDSRRDLDHPNQGAARRRFSDLMSNYRRHASQAGVSA